MYDAIVIGGGASGLCAAIAASRRGRRVLVLEAGDRVGKKILATGNGRCNLSARVGIDRAYNTSFAERVLAHCSEARVEAFFEGLGLPLKEIGGRVYPYSELASSVLGVLRAACERYGTEIRTQCRAERVTREEKGYRVLGESAKRVIVATGSPATFGMDSTCLAEELGLSVCAFRPALVPILTDATHLKGLKGVRAKVLATLYADGVAAAREAGEVLFKDNGLSGIAIFNLSSYIARKEGAYEVGLDFFPEFSLEDLAQLIGRFGTAGLCHKELARNARERAGSGADALARCFKDYRIAVKSLSSPTLAQVMSGGVCTRELTDRCESCKYPGLYFVGETVDVDGLCGGYNLLWAWASGLVAGESV